MGSRGAIQLAVPGESPSDPGTNSLVGIMSPTPETCVIFWRSVMNVILYAGEVLLIDLNPTESSSPDSNPVPPAAALILIP